MLFEIVVAVVALVTGLVGYGYYNHNKENLAADQALRVQQSEAPAVRVLKVALDTAPREIHLPSNTQAFDAATLYARQSGYISKRIVDIGDRVKVDELLALIAAPEVDDQLAQAKAQLLQMRAALEQNQANRSLAEATNRRFSPLVQQGWETKQTGDQYHYNLAAQDAAVDVAKANIEAQKQQIARLSRQQSYERVVAPFNGVITQRNIDVGSLVTGDSTTGTPLFVINNTDVLRVQVYVPQDVAFDLHPGLKAALEVPELQGRKFKGTVTRTSASLYPNSRTLLVEVDIENKDQTLRAGIYGIVHFQIPRVNPVIVIPSQALIFNQDGVQVAVARAGKAYLRKVTIGQDDGATLEISAGLEPGDEVILSPPAGLVDSTPIKIIPDKPGAKH